MSINIVNYLRETGQNPVAIRILNSISHKNIAIESGLTITNVSQTKSGQRKNRIMQ